MSFILLFLVIWPIFGAFISYILGRASKRLRNLVADGVTIVEFIVMLLTLPLVSNSNPMSFEWLGFGQTRLYFVLDGFRYVYGCITSLMWMCTTIFSEEYFAHYRNRNRYYFFMLLTFGATMGVFLSGDLITTFTFFEMMSFTSYVMVLHDEKPGAIIASKTYMAVAVIGGLAMLMGIFIIQNVLGTLQIDKLRDAAMAVTDKKMLYWACFLMLVGFGGKAGMYPLHVWLPNAHPVAPAPASALLSGVLTKTGVYGIIIMSAQIFYGTKTWGMILLVIGVITMFTGAFLAVFSIDLKRTLACSSMSQIGFILVGTSMQCILLAKDTTIHYHFMGVYGTVLHMMNHSLIKLVLFMSAGVVYMNLHKLDLNEIRGFGYRKPLLKFIFGMGVLAIIGMPFWSGYVSKTLIHESIVEQIMYILTYTKEARFFQTVESIFTLTGGLTTAYMTKIYIAVFWEKNAYHQDKMDETNGHYMKPVNAVILTVCSLLLFVLGAKPELMTDGIANFARPFMHGHAPDHPVAFFAWANVRGAVASLSIGAIVYLLLIRGCLMKTDENGKRVYINAWPAWLNIETKFYKPLLLRWLPFVGAFVTRTIGSIVDVITFIGSWLFSKFRAAVAHLAKTVNWLAFYKDIRADHARICGWINGPFNAFLTNEEKWSPRTSVPIVDDAITALQHSKEEKAADAAHIQHDEEVLEMFGAAVKSTLAYSLLLFAIGVIVFIVYVSMR